MIVDEVAGKGIGFFSEHQRKLLVFLLGYAKWTFQLFLLPVEESFSVNFTKKTQFLLLVRAYHK